MRPRITKTKTMTMIMASRAITPSTMPTIAPTPILSLSSSLLAAVKKIRLSADRTNNDKTELTLGDKAFYSMQLRLQMFKTKI